MDMKNQNKPQVYLTSNFYLAGFLIAKGIHLIGIRRTDTRRVNFVFEDGSDRERLLHSYDFAADNDPSVMIDPRRFIQAIRTLKEKLYQEVQC